MSPINITPINRLNLQTKCRTLSQHSQRIVKSQVKSISFELKSFFEGINSELVSRHEEKLHEIGIKQIGKNINEGIIISKDKLDYHVFSNDSADLNFNIIEPNSNQVNKHFSINNTGNEYRYAGDISELNIEDELSEVIDLIEDKIHKAKVECMPVKIPQTYIQTSSTKISKSKYRKKNTDIKNSGYISENEKKLIATILEKLQLSQELYKKISDCRTKYEVRSSYKNYMPQPVANKIGFKNVGENGESISLFYTSYKNDAHTAIIVTDANGNESKFVISQNDKSIRKNLPSRYVKSESSDYRILLTPDYYTQKEIDESKLSSYLSILNKEMDSFIEHTQNWFKAKEEKKLIRSNYDTATLEQYQDLLDDISSNFEKYRAKMRKYLRKPHKSKKFKTENNISTKLASIAVKFDNITPNGDDLRLSFPKVKDKTATQLLVMNGDEIKKSFYIINNKLLRFDIKDLNDKFFHYNQNMYYYDNKYLQESNLHEYLLLIRDKLHNLNKKLDAIRKKQLENKARYHIKSNSEK